MEAAEFAWAASRNAGLVVEAARAVTLSRQRSARGLRRTLIGLTGTWVARRRCRCASVDRRSSNQFPWSVENGA